LKLPVYILRKIELADTQAMFELDSDISVHQYLGKKPITTLAESIAIIQFIHQQYLDHNIGRYAVVEKSTGLFMGWSGLKFIKGPLNEQQNFYELGYRFMPKFWGKGFATEAGIAWINYGFTSMQLPEIFAMAASDNLG
jgi:RimJ/RimL family protein N-acetyltransferase